MKQENTEFQIPITRPAMSESPGSGNGQIAETHVPGQVGPPSLEDLLAAPHSVANEDGRGDGKKPERPRPDRIPPSGDEGSSGGDSGQKPGGYRHYVPKAPN